MDTEGLLRSSNAEGARYVVIGAAAFPVHGYARATMDVDIFIEPTEANAGKVLRALLQFGYTVASELSAEELLAKKILIRQYALETDIHPFAKGVEFEEVWRDAVRSSIGSEPAHFASLQSLIRMKEAAGRPEDIEDLRMLRQLLK